MKAFATQNVANRGNRGRPPLPKRVERRQELILNDKGAELGELTLEAQKDGSVVLTATVNGRKREVVFSAVKAVGRPRKATPAAKKKNTRSSRAA